MCVCVCVCRISNYTYVYILPHALKFLSVVDKAPFFIKNSSGMIQLYSVRLCEFSSPGLEFSSAPCNARSELEYNSSQ